jgi:hypothetical protein
VIGSGIAATEMRNAPDPRAIAIAINNSPSRSFPKTASPKSASRKIDAEDQPMRATVTMNPTSDGTESLRHGIRTFLQFPTCEQCQVGEEDDFDGLTLLTVDFRDPSDADDCKLWRNIGHHICCF